MTEEYQFIEDLHEELEKVHGALENYDGVNLENSYETGPFMPEVGAFEGYEDILEDKESFEDKGCLLRAASSLEEISEMIQRVSGAEYITLGRIPIKGPLGESLVNNINLNYSFTIEEGEVSSYWELDSRRVDTDRENASTQIRGIESIVNEYTSADVKQLPLESESNGLKSIASRAD